MAFDGYSYDEIKSVLLTNNPNTIFGEAIKPQKNRICSQICGRMAKCSN